jgi:hypothetical protein
MEARPQSAAPVLTTIGVDIGKEVFHIVGFDAEGAAPQNQAVGPTSLPTPSSGV